MQKRKIVIIAIIFSALIVGLGVSFAFGNTLNPNCPDEIKQAIQNWDKGLDERDAKNQPMMSLRGSRREPKQSQRRDYFANARNDNKKTDLRTLFLTSLITLTFNTPVHSQILVSNFIQKLFTVAKHYLNLPAYPLTRLLAVLFTVLKRYFEKIFLILLGLIFPTVYFKFLPSTIYHLPSTHLFYKFHNLRL